MVQLSFCSLFVFANAIALLLVDGKKFMSSPQIYLNMSNATLTNITCIKAQTTASNRASRTLSHRVRVHMKNDSEWIWLSMNANYYPTSMTRRRGVRTFTSVDEISNATTNYTFRHTTLECAIVKKEKKKPNMGIETSLELWVNEKFKTNTTFCASQFKKLCPNPTTFDMNDCIEPNVKAQC
ncbi:uncharacterized protein LOC142564898 isoform X2 [Dermacentor variabilis]|uniref:uncharacterized protein LOC142564898 isoform X2 n=1 Tax=Dermacentor variabilis TaxID=34621 RepID=UPI003F5B964C